MSTPDEINTMIADIEKRERYLSVYERYYLEGQKISIGWGYPLTEKEDEKLVAIWNRIKCAPTST